MHPSPRSPSAPLHPPRWDDVIAQTRSQFGVPPPSLPAAAGQPPVGAWSPDQAPTESGDQAPTEEPAPAAPADEAADDPEAADQPGGTQAQKLLDLANCCTLFHTPDRRAFASAPVCRDGPHRLVLPVKGEPFRNWLTRLYYETTGQVPRASALHDATGILAARAEYGGPECPVFCRVGDLSGAAGRAAFLDLATPAGEAVEVRAGGWQVTASPAVAFYRASGMLALPLPTRGGRLDELRPFLNVAGDEDWQLLVGWLLAALRPTGPYPVLCLHGEHGSAKTHASLVLRKLVDPHSCPLRGVPRDLRDLSITAQNSWVLLLDNLSQVADWLSDALCRLSTGGGFATRLLYTDRDEALFHAQRPVILNGIDEVAARADLLDRAIVLHLPVIAQDAYRPEADLRQEFEAARPRLLGALLDATACALRRLPEVGWAAQTRMADLVQWVTGAEPALGWPEGTFLKAFLANRDASSRTALEVSPLVEPLQRLAEQGEWTGSATALLDALRGGADEAVSRKRGWPANPKCLSDQLRRLAPNLRRIGLELTFHRGSKGRLIKFGRLPSGEPGV